jgi:peroxiredoxin
VSRRFASVSRRAALLCALGVLACRVPEGKPGVGSEAPDLVGTTLAGDTVALSSLEGQPVLLNLWATWCAPCRRETPYLQSLHERFESRGLRVVGVTVDTRASRDAVREFMEEFGVGYTILQDPDMVSMDTYMVIGLPATFVIDREGVIRHAVTGPVDEEDREFTDALERVLQ